MSCGKIAEADSEFCGLGLWGLECGVMEALQGACEGDLQRELEVFKAALCQGFGKGGEELISLVARYRGNPYVGIGFGSGCLRLLEAACELGRRGVRIQKLLFFIADFGLADSEVLDSLNSGLVDSELLDKAAELEALARMGVELEFHTRLDSQDNRSKREGLARFGLLYAWR